MRCHLLLFYFYFLKISVNTQSCASFMCILLGVEEGCLILWHNENIDLSLTPGRPELCLLFKKKQSKSRNKVSPCFNQCVSHGLSVPAAGMQSLIWYESLKCLCVSAELFRRLKKRRNHKNVSILSSLKGDTYFYIYKNNHVFEFKIKQQMLGYYVNLPIMLCLYLILLVQCVKHVMIGISNNHNRWFPTYKICLE